MTPNVPPAAPRPPVPNGPPDLTVLSSARTFSVSAENPTGAPGQGGRAERGEHETAWASRELPVGWKKSPCIDLPGGTRRTVVDVEGPGVIQHVWMTVLPEHLRSLVLRMFWDDETEPSVEVPLGDFFCQGFARYAPVTSQMVVVAPAGGLNCYWPMPFSSRARLEIENLSTENVEGFFYQVTGSFEDVTGRDLRLHAQWRRSDPVEAQAPHVILDGVRGAGHYVGTYLAWETHRSAWWGEGEVKMYIDDDLEGVGLGEGGEGLEPPTVFPTVCGTGTEDYVGGAWAFEHPEGAYAEYSTPYLGMPQVIRPDGFADALTRFGMYRWHVPDPVRFRERLRVTVQALGFARPVDGKVRYRPLREDVATTAFWYQTEPHAPFSEDPDCPTPTWDAFDVT